MQPKMFLTYMKSKIDYGFMCEKGQSLVEWIGYIDSDNAVDKEVRRAPQAES